MTTNFDVKAYANAWNAGSESRVLEFYADDAELIVPPDDTPYKGRSEIGRNYREVTGGIKDLNGDLEWSVQQGDRVAALVHVTGRHAGELVVSDEMKIPATDNKLDFRLGVFLELDAQGKIKREIDLADNVGILMQVGAFEGAGGMPSGRQQKTATTR